MASMLALSLLASWARADPVSITYEYSPYEQASIDEALSSMHASVEATPVGKIVEAVVVVPLEVIEPRDPAPRFLNHFHATTRTYVVLREMLVATGDVYRSALVDESGRNLRTLPQLSLVAIVPVVGSTPDRVKIIVITKDVWSLYPDVNDLAVAGGALQSFTLEPKETNVAGTHHALSVPINVQPASMAFGASYLVPRLDGRRLELAASASVVLSRPSDEPEGTFGSVSVARPLFSTRTAWAWSTRIVWDDEITRSYQNAAIATYVSPTTKTDTQIPWAYRSRRALLQAQLTRSFGWENKNDFSLAFEINRSQYPAPIVPGVDPSLVKEFVTNVLPIGETRVGPSVGWYAYSTNFLRTLDLDTLGLQEDVRLGHELAVRVYPVLGPLGSTRTLIGSYAGASYTVALGDGEARVLAETSNEADGSGLTDGALGVDARIVTPRTGFGRLLMEASMLDRYANHLNRVSTLGGDNRLRGYPTGSLIHGRDVVSINVEYRTRAVEVASMQWGAAMFYDIGDAFDGFDQMHPKQGVGVGLRVVVPQIERTVLRLDLGFPVAPGAVGQPTFFITFNQAFSGATLGRSLVTGGTAGAPAALGFLGQ